MAQFTKSLGIKPLGALPPITPTTGGRVPVGYTRSTINGVPVTYNGRRVYDNGSNVIYL